MATKKPVSLFKHFPKETTNPRCQNAYVILCNAHDASSAFLEIFNTVRKTRNAKGMPTDEEQDLLRAMVLFASAGLDSFVKQLIRDALSTVIHKSEGAEELFKEFVERRLKLGVGIDYEALADVMTSVRPRERLLGLFIEDLTSKSLQSANELLRAAAAFDIPSKQITTSPDLLREIFRARNQIAHEMDVDFTRANRSRRARARDLMVAYTEEIFGVAKAFLEEVEAKAK